MLGNVNEWILFGFFWIIICGVTVILFQTASWFYKRLRLNIFLWSMVNMHPPFFVLAVIRNPPPLHDHFLQEYALSAVFGMGYWMPIGPLSTKAGQQVPLGIFFAISWIPAKIIRASASAWAHNALSAGFGAISAPILRGLWFADESESEHEHGPNRIKAKQNKPKMAHCKPRLLGLETVSNPPPFLWGFWLLRTFFVWF